MSTLQLIGICFLLIFACISMIGLIEKNKQDLLKQMYKAGDISESTYKKYLN